MTEKVVREEVMGMYQCTVWKKSAGSSTLYTWRDEDGIKRFNLLVSHRPVRISRTIKEDKWRIRYKRNTYYLEDFVGVSPLKIHGREFKHGNADSMFSGIMIDAGSYARMNGDYVYVARWWS